MTNTVTLGQVEELAVALPLSDQQHLIKRMSERLEARQDYITRAEAFLKTCLENPVCPIAGMDAGEETAAIRAERGEDLA